MTESLDLDTRQGRNVRARVGSNSPRLDVQALYVEIPSPMSFPRSTRARSSDPKSPPQPGTKFGVLRARIFLVCRKIVNNVLPAFRR
jgi:hypothetical protein